MTLRVLLATDGLFPDVLGGMQRHSRFLVEHLAHLDARLFVIHPAVGKRYFTDLPNVEERPLPSPSYRFPWHYPLESVVFSHRIAQLARTLQYDVAYAQGLTFCAANPGQLWRALVNPQGLEMFQTRGRRETLAALPLRFLVMRQARRSGRVVTLGGKLTDVILGALGVPPERVVHLPNAVDVEYVDRLRPARVEKIPRSLLFVGRMVENKGLPVLLEAMRHRSMATTRAFVIGDGPLRKAWEREATANVTFLGRVSERELFDWYSRVEALVFPTLYEGMPTVILEAMAMGLPIIASEVGAISELVGVDNGRLVRAGSAPVLLEAVQAILSLPMHQQQAMGQASRRYVEERFAWPVVATRTLETLRALS